MHQKGNLGISMNMKRITPKMRAMAGNGEYTVSKDEADKIRQRNEANKRKQAFMKAIHEITREGLSKIIGSPITMEIIKSCTDFTRIRNGYSIKYIEESVTPVIQLRNRQRQQYTFRVMK